MDGQRLSNLQMLEALLSTNGMENFVIATTMWNKVDEEEGRKREDELNSKFWKEMVSNGCKTVRFEDTFDSAWDIVGMNSGTPPVGHRQGMLWGWITISRKAVRKAL